MIMRNLLRAVVTISCFAAVAGFGADAQAQIALKSGESVDLGPLYYVYNCKSVLKATPDAEIIDGPPGVTVSVREEMVLPRFQNCAKKVQGGVLTISAKDIDDQSYTNMTVRITYKTKDGVRKRSQVYAIALFPPQ
jgi:hypothetical protein